MNNQTIERGIDMDVEIFSLTGKIPLTFLKQAVKLQKSLNKTAFP